MVFNINKNLKKKAMIKAKKIGVPFSFVLNRATKDFVKGEWEAIPEPEKFNEKTRRELNKILNDVKKGKNLSPTFDNMGEAFKYLGI